jgi:hypothetical protein
MVPPIESLKQPTYYYIPKMRFVKMPSLPPIPALSAEVETWLQSRDDQRRQSEDEIKDHPVSITRHCNIHKRRVKLVLTELSPYGTRLFLFLSITDASISGK